MKIDFWSGLDNLIHNSEIVIDRPKGSPHPNFPTQIYPCNYGYLKGTSSIDGHEIDVWLGTENNNVLNSAICTVDLLKKDCEIKLVIGCSDSELNAIMEFYDGEYMSAMLIKRQD